MIADLADILALAHREVIHSERLLADDEGAADWCLVAESYAVWTRARALLIHAHYLPPGEERDAMRLAGRRLAAEAGRIACLARAEGAP